MRSISFLYLSPHCWRHQSFSRARRCGVPHCSRRGDPGAGRNSQRRRCNHLIVWRLGIVLASALVGLGVPDPWVSMGSSSCSGQPYVAPNGCAEPQRPTLVLTRPHAMVRMVGLPAHSRLRGGSALYGLRGVLVRPQDLASSSLDPHERRLRACMVACMAARAYVRVLAPAGPYLRPSGVMILVLSYSYIYIYIATHSSSLSYGRLKWAYR